MTARLDRAPAGREVLSATERLSDGLLREETRCFRAMASALAEVGSDVWARTEKVLRRGGRGAVQAGVRDLLPSAAVLVDAVMPPVGDLLATTRDRSLATMRRQLRACQSAVSQQHAGHADRAARLAAAEVVDLEEAWYRRAEHGARRAALQVVGSMGDQAGIWASRNESVDMLRQRWVEVDDVRLPGSEARGALLGMRWRMNVEARNASVALTNGVLLTGMRCWNALAAEGA